MVIVVVVAVLFVPLPFQFDVSDPGSVSSVSCGSKTFDQGVAVQFHWNTADGSSVLLTVKDTNGNTLYTHSGSGGSGGFTGNGNSYDFCIYSWTSETVTVAGNAPFL